MKTKKLVLTALFAALCFIGANIKVMGTIAFDSMPAFLAAILLGPVYGAVVGAIGHFLTAVTSGFPLTLPVHLITMIMMGLTMAVFAIVYKAFSQNKVLAAVLAVIAGVLINGPVCLLALSFLLIPMIGKAGLIGLMPVLSIVGAINAILAFAIYKFLPNNFKEYENKILAK
jgi:uncharacterized membrane protein